MSAAGVPARPDASSLLAFVGGADRTACGIYRGMLEREGFAVRVMTNGVAILTAAQHATPDLVVLDEQLLDAPADEAVRWLRSSPTLMGTPIVLVAGRSRRHADRKPPGARVERLRKPVAAGGFRRTVASLVHTMRPQHRPALRSRAAV